MGQKLEKARFERNFIGVGKKKISILGFKSLILQLMPIRLQL